MNTLDPEKKRLREAVLARRDALPLAARKEAAAAVTKTLTSLAAYRAAPVVLTFMSFGSEIDTWDFFATVLADGKIAVLPRVDRRTRELSLHRVGHLDQLQAGQWGIREPRAELPQVALAEIALVIVPGVAFDRAGRRLGYGGGYYDRLLSSPKVPQTPGLARLSIAFSMQIVEQVPVAAHDQPVPLIITETETIRPLT